MILVHMSCRYTANHCLFPVICPNTYSCCGCFFIEIKVYIIMAFNHSVSVCQWILFEFLVHLSPGFMYAVLMSQPYLTLLTLQWPLDVPSDPPQQHRYQQAPYYTEYRQKCLLLFESNTASQGVLMNSCMLPLIRLPSNGMELCSIPVFHITSPLFLGFGRRSHQQPYPISLTWTSHTANSVLKG